MPFVDISFDGRALDGASPADDNSFSRAIMTTDIVEKWQSV